MADVEVMVKLAGVTRLSPPQYDAITGQILGFDLINPNNSTLHIDLSQYQKSGDDDIQRRHHLRAAIYEAYQFLVENVPAATPLFESNARSFPLGVVYKSADGRPYTEVPHFDSGEVDRRAAIEVNGDFFSNQMMYRALGANTMATGGVWYPFSAEELLLHEHVHMSYELQKWPPYYAKDYKNDIAQSRVPELEKAAITFVNQTMREPIGKPLRDASDYFNSAIMPKDGVLGGDVPIDLNRLRKGTIPEALKAYSKPQVLETNSQFPLHLMDFDFAKSPTKFHENDQSQLSPSLEQLKNQFAGLDVAAQSYVLNELNRKLYPSVGAAENTLQA